MRGAAVIVAALSFVLAGCGSSKSVSTAGVNGSQTTPSASPSVAPADVVRDLFAAEQAHNFISFCTMVTPAARVELRRNSRDPLHEIGGSCEQHLMNELARGVGTPSDPIVGFGYTSLRTASETSDTAVVEVKDEREGVTGSARAYTIELERCGESWLWTLAQSGMNANAVAQHLFDSLVRHYGCEPEAEVIKHRGLVIVNEEAPREPSGAGTGAAEG
jgi:hypothetical protein